MVSETGEADSRKKRAEHQRKRLLQPPQFTILGDQPLASEDVGTDSFDLAGRIGPIYDILRHPDTPTPMAMAIYGDWGAGKTSAMQWLDGQLGTWRTHGKARNKITVQSTWFYPWKYQTKEDVWRGLVAEIIISCIEAENPSAKAYLAAINDFGAFLGKSFVSVIAGSKLSIGVSNGSKLTLDGKSAKEIIEHTGALFSPQNAFLNEFEFTIRNWIQKTLGKHERMVVFIDDLDRCLPEVSLQVLEALKLYLNIENLIFLVGVDREVVDSLVREHYKPLGLGDDKSGNYLAKMFSVEVTLSPSDPEIDTFLNELLDRNAAWQDLSEKERKIFRGLIRRLATRSPREAKRLINSSLMAGAGARMSSLSDNPEKQAPTVCQGMQVFFVRRILQDRYTRGSLVAQNRGTRFFTAWSKILEDDENIPETVSLPADYAERLLSIRNKQESPGLTEDDADASAKLEELLSGTPQPYQNLMKTSALADLFELLQDKDLGQLMRLDYPAEAVTIASELGGGDSAQIVRESVARSLNKAPEDLTQDDYSDVRALNLQSQEITDLKPLKALTGLEKLNLSWTQVNDIAPLHALTRLHLLRLSGTSVSDLTPLKALTTLKTLRIDGTHVSDLTPLQALTSLEKLDVSHTRVSDLTPLKALNSLNALRIKGTEVSDLTPLHALSGLHELAIELSTVSMNQIDRLRESLPQVNISA